MSIEIDECVTVEDYDLNPFLLDKAGKLPDHALVRTASGGIVRVRKALELDEIRGVLQTLQLKGYTSPAIRLIHSYIFPDHELKVADLARAMKFGFVVSSALNSPVIKLLRRSNSASTEAYLGPII